ncbi:MAG: chemotaxis protein CheW [Rhodocyclaceae bacterium]|nr:chemotaxis protein CheW [Rhodocyclaceae bacterium]
MSQFYQVFFEETAEHLATMENLLLTLDVGNPDTEQLNAIFRAAHSIKGSSGTFGFTDLAEVTHILENLLDRIRKGETSLREDMIDAFLDAGDVLKNLLAAHQGDAEADREAAAAICRRLQALTGDPAGTPAVAATMEAVPPAPTSAADSPAHTEDGLDLRYVIDGEPVQAEAANDNLLAELAEHGAVRVVSRPEAVDQPWQVQVIGTPEIEVLRELLEFVARNDSIRIAPLGQVEDSLGDSPDGAYGFFDEAAASAGADDAYGFFDALPAPVAEDEDEAFGFFEPLPAVQEAAASPAAAEENDAYGFFAPLPDTAQPAGPAPAVVEAAMPVVAAPEAAPVVPLRDKPAGQDARRAAAPAAKPGGDTTIRVGVDKVDQLINLVGELVITQAMLAQSAAHVDPVEFERLHNGLIQLERNTRDLQEAVMSIRMMPMSVVFSRFPRVVRDISQKLGKQVELKLSGESTELDKGLIERITDPLTHLVRNSLDHGIEPPDVRAAKGKQPVGTITLSAYHQSGNIVIEVGDDGAGLNREKILSKAKERGLNVHDQMSDQEVFQLIFEAGFSTADQITDVSGRGVGMDVVKKNITAMGGRVEIDSMAGVGTRMTVRLPLTLAILDGMSVAVGRETYIIPLGYVIESLQADRSMMKSVSGVEKLIQVRDDYLPVVTLHELFGVPDAVRSFEDGIMIILETDGIKAALFVDAMVGQHQVVIKSLESNYRKVPGIAGATIMGDGRVALILDVSMLVGMARHALPTAA